VGGSSGPEHIDLSQIGWDRSRLGVPLLRSTSSFPRPRHCVLALRPAPRVPVAPEEESLARRGQRQPRARRTVTRKPRRVHDRDGGGIIAVLARAVREVEAAVQQGTAKPSVRTKFQVVALLMRQERARAKTDEASSVARRAEQLKRLDGIGTILAKSAARDPSLLALLEEDAAVSDAGRALERDMLRAAGVETDADEVTRPVPETSYEKPTRGCTAPRKRLRSSGPSLKYRSPSKNGNVVRNFEIEERRDPSANLDEGELRKELISPRHPRRMKYARNDLSFTIAEWPNP